jgi:hypothetical protein
MWLIHIGVVKNTRVTMLMEDDGFHGTSQDRKWSGKEQPADISEVDMLEVPDRVVL